MHNKGKSKIEDDGTQETGCSCGGDPFASLPPDRQPRKKSWKANLHNVTCPTCGNKYWTDRDIKYCSTCRKRK